MHILGISALYHDSAAALLHSGSLVAAAQEERFSRIKLDHAFPAHAIDFCLKRAGIEAADLDYAVFYEKPLPKFERILMSSLSTYPRSWQVFRESMLAWLSSKLWLKTTLMDRLRLPADRILFVEHHLSHAASAMYCSPFHEAAVLTIDGVGEWTTAAMGKATADWGNGAANTIELTHELRYPHSLGVLYSAFTAWLGFKVNSGEYKVMGMAPYGQSRYQDKLSKIVTVYEDGSLWLNMDYFSFHHSMTQTFSPAFVALFGPPRVPEAPFFTTSTGDNVQGRETDAAQNQYYADIAATIQSLTEEIILKMARHLHSRTGLKKLVAAGGVALNSVANGRLMRETPFDEIYIQPNAGDAGGALGAALYAWHVLLGKPRSFVMEHASWGKEYTPGEIAGFLDRAGARYTRYDDEKLVEVIASGLAKGKVVGWFQGRFEWGPRALGNRSILADPRKAEMKDIVNSKIKFRELFRPFAPAIAEEDTPAYFDLGRAAGQYPQRFMLMVSPILPEKCAEIPAVSHRGTGRLQTVRREDNSLYYDLIKQFGSITGVPVLLNTSFNLRGEPIVTSPADAFSTFSNSGIDTLVLGSFVVEKDKG